MNKQESDTYFDAPRIVTEPKGKTSRVAQSPSVGEIVRGVFRDLREGTGMSVFFEGLVGLMMILLGGLKLKGGFGPLGVAI